MQRQSFKEAILNRRMLICVFTGFTSGLPLYVLIQLVPAWLRVEGVGLAEIGFFALVGFPYTWKFLWSPIMDRYTLPFLGRRRGWMLVTQLALLASIASMGFIKPDLSIWTVAYLAADNPGLCILTTRLSLTDLQSFKGKTALVIDLEHLSHTAGAAFLLRLGVRGAAHIVEPVGRKSRSRFSRPASRSIRSTFRST